VVNERSGYGERKSGFSQETEKEWETTMKTHHEYVVLRGSEASMRNHF
jgi:hypothetical protein